MLVGCRSASGRSNLGLGVGRGVVIQNYVVPSPFHIGYEQIHGLRSDWILMADWAGTQVVDWDVAEHEQGQMQAGYHLMSHTRILRAHGWGVLCRPWTRLTRSAPWTELLASSAG